jgi:hypothetical protein
VVEDMVREGRAVGIKEGVKLRYGLLDGEWIQGFECEEIWIMKCTGFYSSALSEVTDFVRDRHHWDSERAAQGILSDIPTEIHETRIKASDPHHVGISTILTCLAMTCMGKASCERGQKKA